MKNNKDNIDHFFNKAVHNTPHFEYNEADWVKMNALLDKEILSMQLEKIKRYRRRWLLLMLLTTMALSFATVQYIKYRNIAQKTGPATSKNIPEQVVQESIDNSIKKQVPILQQAGTTIDYKHVSTSNEVAIMHKNTGIAVGKSEPLKALNIFTNSATQSKDHNELSLSQQAETESPTTTQTLQAVNIPHIKLGNNTLMPFVEIKPLLPPISGSKSMVVNPKKWELVAGASLQYYNTGTYNFENHAIVKAFSARYHITDKFRIEAGISKGDLKFAGDGASSKLSKRYWAYATNGVTPSKLWGTLESIQIPVTLSYRLNKHKNSRIDFHTGIVNDILLEEYCNFEFPTPNPGSKDYYESSSKHYYAASALHMGLSWQHKFNKNWGLEVQPYYRNPMRNLSWSRYRFKTSGISLNLIYTP